MGGAFGADFGAVRLHTDAEAGDVSHSVQARAFTYGSDIYFAEGAYAPGTPTGQHLLAHELAHVTQPGPAGQPTIGRADDPAEAHADRVADSVLRTLRRQALRADTLQTRREATREVSTALRRQVGSPDAGGTRTTALVDQVPDAGTTMNPAVAAKTVAPPSRDGEKEVLVDQAEHADPVGLRSASDQGGVIRRFYAVVDKPEAGKTYGKVGGAQFEWIEGERDKTRWELSPIVTSWWMRKLYQRVKPVEVGKGAAQGFGNTPDKGADLGGRTSDDKLADADSSGPEVDVGPEDGKKRNGARRDTAKGLGSEDKQVLIHLRTELQLDKDVGEDPASEAKAGRVKDLIAQSEQLDGKPDLASETIAKMDDAAIAHASSRNSGAKGGASSKDEKVPDTSVVEAKPFEVPSSEREKFATEWGLGSDDAKFVFAMSSQANLDYFSVLTVDQRTYLSKTKMKKRDVPTQGDIENFKVHVKEIQAQEVEKARKDQEMQLALQAKAAGAKKRDEGEKEWAARKIELREAVKKRVEAELPDYKWEKEFDNLIGAADDRIARTTTINIPNQIKGTTRDANAALDAEQKRRDVAAIEKNYPDLASPAMRDAKEEVIETSPGLTAADFEQLVKNALTVQRNPKPDTWARLLKVKLYQKGKVVPFERLTEQLGYQTHYSVDLGGMTLPVVTDTTTPEELLDALFGIVDKGYRLHVTLETGAEAGADELKLPHGYWKPNSATPLYELRFAGGNLRWNDEAHSEAQIKGALNDAYTEIRTRLVDRATVVLDHHCHPRYLE